MDGLDTQRGGDPQEWIREVLASLTVAAEHQVAENRQGAGFAKRMTEVRNCLE
jgi:hypothetical protein